MRTGSQIPRLASLPAGIANTDAGDEVIEFAERFGLVLDPWQRWVVQNTCAERADGSWAATQAVLLVPRQAGKSSVLEALEMAALFLWDYEHVIYSAHLQKTSTDHMRRIRRHIDRNPDLKRTARLLTGKGDERVERTDTGAILEFITRGKKTSRGGSPGMVIFDEAMFLQDDEIQAMVPALSAQSMNEDASAQMIYTSSAPIAESTVLHRLRNRGINDKPPRMFFAEWSAPAGCDPSDREFWYQANPGLGIRISEEWVEDNEFGTLSDEAFCTERLGVPIDPVGHAARPVKLPLDEWAAAAVNDDVDGPITLAYEVAPDGEWSSIVFAGGDQHSPYVQVLKHQRGTAWLPAEFTQIVQTLAPTRIGFVAGGEALSQSGAVRLALSAAGVTSELEAVPMAAYRASCGAFYTAVVEGHLRWYSGSTPLDQAARDASERRHGDAWSWDIRNATVPISPLVAATVARALLPVEVKQEVRKAQVYSF